MAADVEVLAEGDAVTGLEALLLVSAGYAVGTLVERRRARREVRRLFDLVQASRTFEDFGREEFWR